MGYNTDYTLEHDVTEDTLQEVRDQFGALGYIFDSGGLEALYWYEHEEDLLRISALCPEFTFTLTGIGETAGDLWKKRFRAGAVEEVRAEIVWPEFEAILI
jgi:hypothetical protein